MPHIHLKTIIKAPGRRVFDLSRSIDLHQQSMKHTNERAVDGRTTGVIQLNETVTWEAKHLFKNRYLKVVITQMQPYSFFQDEMITGDFKKMIHQHLFTPQGDSTIMTDDFYFESPYGMVGKVVNKFFLTSYMQNLLKTRNQIIKEYAETEQWKAILHEE